MDKEFIEIKGKTLILAVCITTFKEADSWIAYAPSLNISGYGETTEEALNSFKVSLDMYVEWVLEHKTLEADLAKLGWKEEGNEHSFNKCIPAKYIKSHKPFKQSYALA